VVTNNGNNNVGDSKNNGEKTLCNAKPKMPGGITGKGFVKGKIANPNGRRGNQLVPKKRTFELSDHLRDWLRKQDWVRDADGNKIGKELRLETIIKNLAANKPEILLHYAYGKPLERTEITAGDGTNMLTVIVRHAHEAQEVLDV
jgi:hypothetical protein